MGEVERAMRRLNRRLRRLFATSALAAATVTHAWGVQKPSPPPDGGATPSFEVATVKPDRNDTGTVNYGITSGRFSAENATVEELIGFAYNVKTDGGIEGEPKWVSLEKYDIDAKIADAEARTMNEIQPTQRVEQYRLMVQSLLAERFGLITSTQIKERPVYALVVAKKGPKLTQLGSKEQRMPMLWGGSRGQLHAASVSMTMLADWISGNPDTDGRVVIDQTGLTGSYDFTLTWTRIGSNGTTGAMTADREGPSFFTALQEQLGLKLEPAKGPVRVVVIQHVVKPSPN